MQNQKILLLILGGGLTLLKLAKISMQLNLSDIQDSFWMPMGLMDIMLRLDWLKLILTILNLNLGIFGDGSNALK
jgi:hypothetical protein